MKIADAGFFESVRGSRRILLIVFGGLGDVVHNVPALRSVRLNFPQARIDVLVQAGGAAILRECLDGFDHIIPHYARQAGWSGRNLRQFWSLFRARYDLCINFWGSNHSSLVALCTGARVRLGRQPFEVWKKGWRLCHTHVAVYPYQAEPMHVQWSSMLEQLGFRVDRRFALRPDAQRFAATGLEPALGGRYIHISTNAGDVVRELPPALLAQVVNGLARRLPEHPLVLSTSPAPRHQQFLRELLPLLERPPARVLAGTLDTGGLLAVIQNAALHLSADSGPLHMAVAAGTPSVSWFIENRGMLEYLPSGPRHFAFVVPEKRAEGIVDIAPAAIVEKCVELLSATPAGSAPERAS
ncbi:MAG: glycosyltransferase family 9 protein [Nevskia sp.]|nr:glycosyltransferase family 9 protein [Nevskia sp.]